MSDLAQYLDDIIRTDNIPLAGNAEVLVEYDRNERVLNLTEVDGRGNIQERANYRIVEVEKQWVPR